MSQTSEVIAAIRAIHTRRTELERELAEIEAVLTEARGLLEGVPAPPTAPADPIVAQAIERYDAAVAAEAEEMTKAATVDLAGLAGGDQWSPDLLRSRSTRLAREFKPRPPIKYRDRRCPRCGKPYTPSGARQVICADCKAQALEPEAPADVAPPPAPPVVAPPLRERDLRDDPVTVRDRVILKQIRNGPRTPRQLRQVAGCHRQGGRFRAPPAGDARRGEAAQRRALVRRVKKLNGAVFYRGPSRLTGAPIVAVLTGLEGQSLNPKTGPVVQSWVLRSDMQPMTAKRRNLDDAICGDCVLRGHNGTDSGCYVQVWFAPTSIWRCARRGDYPEADAADVRAVLEGRVVRICSYGDPAALPFEVWQNALSTTAAWIGYTHAWRTCDPRFQTICMASVEAEHEHAEATAAGWRSFRIRRDAQARVLPGEFVCPASDEGQHRTTCDRCALCRGTSSPARSVVIAAHGMASSLKAFGIRASFFGRPA